MGQVPGSHPPVGIVGNGRVAWHFRHYFHLLGLDVRMWSRRDHERSPVAALAGCATVFVLIRDEAIVPFIEAWPALRAQRLVHCSGSVTTPLAIGAHPLMTFADSLYDLPAYQRIPFVVDEGAPPLSALVPGLRNPSFVMPPASRAFYHALCVMAGNFTTILWTKLFDEFDRRFGIPAAAAHPYLEQIVANLRADPDRALTGPLVRGDWTTVAANIAALEGDPFQGVYRAFARLYDQRR